MSLAHPLSRALDDTRGVALTGGRARLAAVLLLVVTTLAVFSPSLSADFVGWDDHVNLLRNTDYRGLTWAHLRWMATATTLGHYIPLTWLSFGIDHALWGMDPQGYHFTNLLLHVGAAVAFFAVTLRLLGRATALGDGPRLLGAMFAAIFFAAHPLRAESVAWVTERRDVLSGFFFLLSILGYLMAQDTSARARRRFLLAASVAAYAASMASKAIGMGLPLVLLILDVYPLRRLTLGSGAWRRARGVLIEKIPYVIVGGAGAGVAYFVVKTFTSLTTLDAFPWSGRVAMVFYTLWFYVTRTFVPVALSPLYELPAHVSLREPAFALPALAVLATTVALFLLRKRWPAGLAVWAAYAVILAPVSGVVHAGFQLAHDRYSYLSCLGWALLLGAAVGSLADRRIVAVSVRLRALTLAAATAWLLALGWLGWRQVHVWQNTHTLWLHAIDSDPACALCHGNLAAFLVHHDEVAGALRHAQQAIGLRPERPRPYGTLGAALIKAGRPAEAVAPLQRFLARIPDSPEILTLLGVAYVRSGRPADALVPLRHALALAPDNPTARIQLAEALVKLGERQAAMAEYRALLANDPHSTETRYAVGWAFVQFGDVDAARREHAILEVLDARLAARLARELATIQ